MFNYNRYNRWVPRRNWRRISRYSFCSKESWIQFFDGLNEDQEIIKKEILGPSWAPRKNINIEANLEQKNILKEKKVIENGTAISEQTSEKEKEESEQKDNSVRVHKKPIQLRDIENRSSNNRKTSLSHESDEKIRRLLNKEKKQYYKQTWNKLDNGMKINRIKLFIESEKEKRTLLFIGFVKW